MGPRETGCEHASGRSVAALTARAWHPAGLASEMDECVLASYMATNNRLHRSLTRTAEAGRLNFYETGNMC
jgi:hypothetical protein